MSKLTYETRIPFEGFYCSFIDCQINQEIDYQLESRDLDYDRAIIEIDYIGIAKAYLSEFQNCINIKYNLNASFEFVALQSPKEYNFSTDQIFAYISAQTLRTLHNLAYPNLAKHVKKTFAPRDGFIPYYSNVLEDWPSEIIDWDYVQIGEILEVLCEPMSMTYILEDYDLSNLVDVKSP